MQTGLRSLLSVITVESAFLYTKMIIYTQCGTISSVRELLAKSSIATLHYSVQAALLFLKQRRFSCKLIIQASSSVAQQSVVSHLVFLLKCSFLSVAQIEQGCPINFSKSGGSDSLL